MNLVLDEQAKARAVGVGIFALAGAILLPWLFGSPVDPRSSIQSRFAEQGSAQPLGPLSAVEEPRPTEPPISATAAPVAMAPTPSPQPQPEQPTQNWELQLASYVDAKSAEAFVQRLRKAGLEPQVAEINNGGRRVWRVRLALRMGAPEAKALQKELDARYRIRSVLRER